MTSLPALDPRLLDDDAWRRAGQRVRERRVGLSLSERDAAKRAELDVAIWQRVERGGGRLCRRRRVEAVCTALGWAPDAIERLVVGDEPSDIGSGARRPPLALRPLTTRDAQHTRVVCLARVGVLGAVLIEGAVVLYTMHAL
jgi:hypothetical protein